MMYFINQQGSGQTVFRQLALLLRRIFQRVPLGLPLCAVVGALLGGLFLVLPIVALLVAAGLRLWRIGVATVLCAVLALVQQERLQYQSSRFSDFIQTKEVVHLEGTIVRCLNKGYIIDEATHNVRVVVRGDAASRRQGDYIQFSAEKSHVSQAAVPGMFDATRRMQQQGIAADLRWVEGSFIARPFSWAYVCGVASAVRESLADRLMPPGTESDARRQVLCALVLGDKTRAEDETMADFRKGGCLHAFAVSGLHVGLLGGILWGLLRLCRVSKSISRWLVLLIIGLYVVMTGFAVPAVRAYMMMAIVLFGAILRRRVSLFNTWCFVALLILLPQPYQIWNAGFQLSFVVYAAICAGVAISLRESPWFGPDSYIPYRIRTTAEHRYSRFELALRGIIIVSLWAWLVSLPITMSQFHAFNAYSFVTNILISPLLPVVMAAGLAAILSAGIPILGGVATQAALAVSGWLISIVSLCGDLPAAYLPMQMPRTQDEFAIISAGYGESACQLGNGGLLIATGNENTARFHIEPAVFHSGFTPAVLLLPKPSSRRLELSRALSVTWPHLQVIDAASLQADSCVKLQTTAGAFVIYAPPANLPHKPMDNAAPIVLWHRTDGKRILYVGDASIITFEHVPAEARAADILVLGHNKRMPLTDAELIRETGASQVIWLPSAVDSPLSQQQIQSAESERISSTPGVYFYK